MESQKMKQNIKQEPSKTIGETIGQAYSQIVDEPNKPASSKTWESDWQAKSILLFAEQTCQLLSVQEGMDAVEKEQRRILCSLVKGFMRAVQAYYTKGINLIASESPRESFWNDGVLTEEPPSDRHRRMIDRIGEEWMRLMSFVTTAQFFLNAQTKDDSTLKKLLEVIHVAQGDLNLQAVQGTNANQPPIEFAVLPHFGRHFELVKFRYADTISIMGIPVTSLYCPWDWTFIWHEVAGTYIEHSRRNGSTIVTNVWETLQTLVNEEDVWPFWSTTYRRELAGIPLEYGRPLPAILKNWAEELIEDAVGVLCLGDSMAEALDGILTRHYGQAESTATDAGNSAPHEPTLNPERRAEDLHRAGTAEAQNTDDRHPPRGLRVAVAKSLSALMLGTPDPQLDPAAPMIAAQIWANKDLLVTRTYKDLVDRELAREELDPADQLRKQIAEATSSFRTRQHSGNEIRAMVYGHAHARPEIEAANDLLNEYTTWDALDQFIFSESDQGQATPNANSDSWLGYLSIWVSNVSAHGVVHSGNCRLYHSH